MKQWVLNPDNISMSLWEGDDLWARIQQRVGINKITGEYYLVPDTFDITFYKDYLSGVGFDYDENKRVLVPMAFTDFRSIDEALQLVSEFIKTPFPGNLSELKSDQIINYMTNIPVA